MTVPKTKQMSKSKGMIIMLIALGIFFIIFLMVAINTRDIIAVLATLFLGFIWILTLSKYIQDRIFKKSLKNYRKEKPNIKDSLKLTNVVKSSFENVERPPFSCTVYSKVEMPSLSIEGKKLCNTIYERIQKFGNDLSKSLFIVIFANWVLLILVSTLFETNNISYFDHIKFSVISSIIIIILLAANIRSAFAQGIPLLLSIVWLSHPIIKGLGAQFAKDDLMTTQTILFLIAGGAIIFALWLLFFKFRFKKYREFAKKTPAAKLLFLWVFRTQSALEMISNFGYKWKILGPIFYLNGSGMMSSDDFKLTSKIYSGKKLMIENESDLNKQIRKFSFEPDRYGSYKVQSVLCGDGIWKQTLNYFTKTSDLVLMSLCNYTEKNRGCEFEIRKLIDNIPSQKFILFVNERTDMAELKKDLKEFWQKMSPTSPNLIENPHPIIIYKMSTRFIDEYEEQKQGRDEKSTVEKFKRLKSLAFDGDNIVKLLCNALALKS